MKRCVRCVMPDTVPGLCFDSSGLCRYCHDFKAVKALGRSALDAVVEPTRNRTVGWDCLVPLSGGRDSTYALFFASRVLQRNVLAVSFDNEFLTPVAIKNMTTACDHLGVELKLVGSRKGYFKKIVRETIRCAPSVKQLSVCRACDIGIKSVVFRTALEHRIPLIIWGESHQERTSDMTPQALSAVTNLPSRYWKLLNPRFYLAEIFMLLFKRELRVPGNSILKNSSPVLRNPGITQVRLYDYIPWDRTEIKTVIEKELGWTKPDGAISTWKIDCALYPLVIYEFFKIFGCSKDYFGYTRMINSGNMSRKEALRQEEGLKDHYLEPIYDLLSNRIGLPDKEVKRIFSF